MWKYECNLEKFEMMVEETKNNFPTESNDMALGLIYDYQQLNAYGKVIVDKICLNKGKQIVCSTEEQRGILAALFKEKCQQGKCDKYSFIFWALMVLTVDDTNKEEYLSLICDFSRFLGINDEEMIHIVHLLYVAYQ